jgi:hypothetical protein
MASSPDRLPRGAHCANTNFRGADLTGSRWERGVFVGCNFTGAVVAGADFTDAQVRDSTGIPGRGGLPGATVQITREVPPQRPASRLRPGDRGEPLPREPAYGPRDVE